VKRVVKRVVQGVLLALLARPVSAAVPDAAAGVVPDVAVGVAPTTAPAATSKPVGVGTPKPGATKPGATEPRATEPSASPPRAPSPWPELAALLPGVLLHGSGTWLQGRQQTSERLLTLEGVGLLGTFASGFVLFQTGAARNLVGPTALVAVAGVSTFGLSFLANLYATWAPREGFGEPRRSLSLLESALGYTYVYDPQFAFRHFLTTRLDARVDAWHLSLGTAHAPEQDNQRYELGAGFRLWDATGDIESTWRAGSRRDGSYLEPRVGFSEHRYDGSGFLTRVLELELEGRVDVQRLLPDVRGAFFQLGAGVAEQWFVFDLPQVAASDTSSLLLAHAGFGMYLGQRSGGPGGELELYYDHRHDGFAGGLRARGLGSGVPGHFGLRSQYALTPRWGVRAEVQTGSAWVVNLAATLRVGQR
jgi:hypothetical protein